MGEPQPQVIRVRWQAEFEVKRSNEMRLREADHLCQSRRRDQLAKVGLEVPAHGRERPAAGTGMFQRRAACEQALEERSKNGLAAEQAHRTLRLANERRQLSNTLLVGDEGRPVRNSKPLSARSRASWVLLQANPAALPVFRQAFRTR